MKNSILYITSFLICLALSMTSQAQNVLNADWDDVVEGNCDDQDDSWWNSDEAIRIAENVLLYQKDCGGWPKNTQMQEVLTQAQKDALIAAKPYNSGSTIDNDAVKLELTYLSKVHKAIADGAFKTEIRTGFLKGIQYILDAQYNNGGWPQFYPLRGGYSNHITYNDDAMTNVMFILRHIYQEDGEYSIVAEDSTKAAAVIAFDKGLECILNTQYWQNDVLTVWCAQHHYETLLPARARSYELASLSGFESKDVIELLMSIENPSSEIKRAILAAVNWYDRVRIPGLRLEYYTNDDGLVDIRVVADSTAEDMWARFYTLENNTPFFCDRDGIMKFSLAEIGYERRNNYRWYVDAGYDVFEAYDIWYPLWGDSIEREAIIASPVSGTTYYTTDTIPVIAYVNKYPIGNTQKFELFFDTELINDLGYTEIDTFLADIETGIHSIVV
ncbi:MAG: pectate lyase, partial [Bacteroidales bacterium]